MANKLNFNGAKAFNNQSNMPQITAALSNWQDALTIGKVVVTWDGGEKVETITSMSFTGTIQPLGAKQIALKPEGERAWKWLQIHVYSGSLDIDIDNKIYVDNEKYKVMAIFDYARNGFMEYHIVRDYD